MWSRQRERILWHGDFSLVTLVLLLHDIEFNLEKFKLLFPFIVLRVWTSREDENGWKAVKWTTQERKSRWNVCNKIHKFRDNVETAIANYNNKIFYSFFLTHESWRWGEIHENKKITWNVKKTERKLKGWNENLFIFFSYLFFS